MKQKKIQKLAEDIGKLVRSMLPLPFLPNGSEAGTMTDRFKPLSPCETGVYYFIL